MDRDNCRCKSECKCSNSERCYCSLKCFCEVEPRAVYLAEYNKLYYCGDIIYSDTDGIIDISQNYKLKVFSLNVESNIITNPKSKHDYKIKSTPLDSDNKSVYADLNKLVLKSDYDIDVDIDSFGSNYSHFEYKAYGNLTSAEYLNFANHHRLGKL